MTILLIKTPRTLVTKVGARRVLTKSPHSKVTVSRAGAPGAPGPAGPAGATFEHTQGSALATWTINHNLGFKPSIQLYRVGDVQIVGEVIHVSVNQALAMFSEPVSGYARCN